MLVEEIPRPKAASGRGPDQGRGLRRLPQRPARDQGRAPLPVPTVLGHEMSGTVVERCAGRHQRQARRPRRQHLHPALRPLPPAPAAATTSARTSSPCTAPRASSTTARPASTRRRHAARHVQHERPRRVLRRPRHRRLPLLPEVALQEACILGCAVPTAYSAVRHQGDVRPGQTVAVVGSAASAPTSSRWRAFRRRRGHRRRHPRGQARRRPPARRHRRGQRHGRRPRGSDRRAHRRGRRRRRLRGPRPARDRGQRLPPVRDGGRVVIVGLAPSPSPRRSRSRASSAAASGSRAPSAPACAPTSRR